MLHIQRVLLLSPALQHRGVANVLVEDLCNLLKRVPLCLREEKVDERQDYTEEEAEDDVVLPRNGLHCDRVDEQADDVDDIVEGEREGETLCTEPVGEYLARVGNKKVDPGRRVEETKEKDKADNGARGSSVGIVFGIRSRARCPDDVRAKTSWISILAGVNTGVRL